MFCFSSSNPESLYTSQCGNRIAPWAKRLHTYHQRERASSLAETLVRVPAYAKDGKVVCFFQAAAKFNTRYATFGFSDKANLDEGNLRPAAYALKGFTAAEETRIAAIVKKAVS